ncbi:MAG: hypothetical protein ACHBN1_20590 [Heteroscytonema crispum UTEX LB 1556]
MIKLIKISQPANPPTRQTDSPPNRQPDNPPARQTANPPGIINPCLKRESPLQEDLKNWT